MADLIELDLVVREKGLKQSLSTVERLERQLTKAAKAIDENRISQDRYNKILLSAKRQYEALGVSSQKATASVRKFAESQRGAMGTTDNLTNSIKRQTEAQMAATKQSNRMGVVTQQAGYQVSDFIVQVQSGTNVFVAFGQQASQLVGILPLMASSIGLTTGAAIALSAALGIIIPLVTAVGAAFLRAKETSADAGDALYTFKEASTAAAQEVKSLTIENYMLTKGIESSKVAMLDFAIAAQEAKTAANDLANEASILFGPNGIFELGGGFTVLGFEIVKTDEEKLALLKEQRETIIDQNEQLRIQKANKQTLIDIEKAHAKYLEEQKEAQIELKSFTVDTLEALRRRNQLAKAYLAGGQEAVEQEQQLHDNLDLSAQIREKLLAVEGMTNEEREIAEQAILRQVKITQDLEQEVQDVKDEAKRVAEETAKAEREAQKLRDAFAQAAAVAMNINVPAAEKLANLKAQVDGFNRGLTDSQVRIQDAARKAELAARKAGVDSAAELASISAEAARIERETIAAEEALKSFGNTGNKTANEVKNGLSDAEQAALDYAKSLDNTVVGAVDSLSNAWADFVMRGFKDFSNFKDAIINSFKNMIAQMIAIAVKNRIMLSLGIGGVAPSAAMAQTGMLGGSTLLGGGGAGIGAAASGIGSGLSGVLSGGGLSSSFANLGGLMSGSVGGMGAIGAALPAVGVIVGGAMLLKSIFGSKPIISQENMNKVNSSLEMTGQSLNTTGKEAQLAAKALGDVAGGFDALTQKSQFFYENFYSEAERQDIATAKATETLTKAFADLEMAVPQTRDQFRSLVESQDLMTEEGRKTYNALLDVAQAFTVVSDATANASTELENQRVARDREQAFAERQGQRLREGLTGRGPAGAEIAEMGFFERTSATNKAFLNIYVNFLKGIKDQGKALTEMLGNIQGLNTAFASGNIGLTSFLESANDFAVKTKEGFTKLAENTLRASTDIGLSSGGLAFSSQTLSDFISGVQSRGAGAAQAMGQQFSQGYGGVSQELTNVVNFFNDLGTFVAGPIKSAMTGLRENLGTLRSSLQELKSAEQMASEAISAARESGQMVTESQMSYYNDLTNNIGLTQEASAVAIAEMQRLKEVSVVIPEQAAALEAAVLSNLSGGVVNAGRMVQLVGTYGANLGKQIAVALTNAANAGIQGVMSAFGQFGSLYSSGAITKTQYQSLTNEITGFLDVAKSTGGGGGGGGGSAISQFRDSMKSFVKSVQDSIDALKGLKAEEDELGGSRRREVAYLKSVRQITENELDNIKKSIDIVKNIDERDYATRFEYMREVGRTINLLESLQYRTGVLSDPAVDFIKRSDPQVPAVRTTKNTNQPDVATASEVRELRTEMRSAMSSIAKFTRKTADTLNKFDYDGLPDSRGF